MKRRVDCFLDIYNKDRDYACLDQYLGSHYCTRKAPQNLTACEMCFWTLPGSMCGIGGEKINKVISVKQYKLKPDSFFSQVYTMPLMNFSKTPTLKLVFLHSLTIHQKLIQTTHQPLQLK